MIAIILGMGFLTVKGRGTDAQSTGGKGKGQGYEQGDHIFSHIILHVGSYTSAERSKEYWLGDIPHQRSPIQSRSGLSILHIVPLSSSGSRFGMNSQSKTGIVLGRGLFSSFYLMSRAIKAIPERNPKR
jgi:hypothetical protein